MTETEKVLPEEQASTPVQLPIKTNKIIFNRKQRRDLKFKRVKI